MRLRYYISHRLVAQAGEAHSDAWRLPAEEFETKVGKLVQMMLAKHGFAAKLVRGASADAIGRHAATLAAHAADADPAALLGLVGRIDIMPGQLELRLDAGTIADLIGIAPEHLDRTRLNRSFPFQLRKRGVETKIIFDDAVPETDGTLIRNIAKAHAWFERIKAGETISEIAASEGTSKRRVQQLVGLAFLAPDIVRDVLEGRQPIGFTSEWCLRHDVPSDWTEQRQLLATL
ncbi:hypothetical protein PVV74_03985 [Roseovarius sp. SK2]|uniref:hypothetical protein n=1 Tax=Roseovarius TaxID=74030 RepID=UPI00237A4818|nr:hypothetical protein [Roseovarius sp. SK2]MDD9724610.1 hypothetical protein [Roseovarius sp. SK2]